MRKVSIFFGFLICLIFFLFTFNQVSMAEEAESKTWDWEWDTTVNKGINWCKL